MVPNYTKSFILVYGKKYKSWCILLSNLMGAVGISASCCDEAKYLAQEFPLGNQNKVVFVGDSKIAKDHKRGMVWKFDEFGIKYGWLGNSAIIDIEDAHMSRPELQKFIDFYEGKSKEIDTAIKFPKKENSDSNSSVPTGAAIGAEADTAGAVAAGAVAAGAAAASATGITATIGLLGTAGVMFLSLPAVAITLSAAFTGGLLANAIANKTKKEGMEKFQNSVAKITKPVSETFEKIGDTTTQILPESKKITEVKWELAIRLFFCDSLQEYMEG